MDRNSNQPSRQAARANPIYAVVVLYRQHASASVTIQTLAAALKHPGAAGCEVLVYDNSPAADTSPPALPDGFQCQAAPNNRGLLGAYEAALVRARAGGFEWLLTLDQDSRLPADFFISIQAGLDAAREDPRVGAIVPHLVDGDRLLSPAYVGIGRACPLPRRFNGVPPREARAFNSAALLRIAAIEDIGGFHPCFWLDHLDSWLHHALFTHGWRMYVLGSTEIEHHFSLLDYKERLSPDRYRNFITAESAYQDLYGSWFERAAYTLQLDVRLVNQVRGREAREIREATRRCWIARMTVPRMKRLREWRWDAGCDGAAAGSRT